jgi:DeoR/GlpR family transcriptional regulator of sugar metabolism
MPKTKPLGQYKILLHESMLIMQYVDRHQLITISDAEKIITTVSTPTIKNRFTKLVKQGLLIQHCKARSTWYNKPE